MGDRVGGLVGLRFVELGVGGIYKHLEHCD